MTLDTERKPTPLFNLAQALLLAIGLSAMLWGALASVVWFLVQLSEMHR